MPFDGLSNRRNSGDNSSMLRMRTILAGWKPMDRRMPSSRGWRATIVTVLGRIPRSNSNETPVHGEVSRRGPNSVALLPARRQAGKDTGVPLRDKSPRPALISDHVKEHL